jgi:hypothetical protein
MFLIWPQLSCWTGVGGWQVVVLHGTSWPSHTSGAKQSAWVVIEQAPVAVLQQAPVTGGG